MTTSKNTKTSKAAPKKEAWIDPAISEMDVAKVTKGAPGMGADGGGFADCTLS